MGNEKLLTPNSIAGTGQYAKRQKRWTIGSS